MQWIRGGLIGKGSFGRVYHALNLVTGEWIAVKEVDTAITQADKLNRDMQEAADALYREVSLLKDLDHENIVQYIGYDSDVTEGHIYIFLEYVPGGSISSLLSQFRPFDETLTSFFTRQILKGLEYLHERHILHRVKKKM
jgi:serine/threonine protein kinase